MKLVILAAAALALTAVGPVKAEKGAGPCKADVEKFCKDVKPGGGRIIDCLKAHESELSADCKAKGMKAKGKARAIVQVCKADLEKFCKDAEGGRGGKLRCLVSHEVELSTACKTAVAAEKLELAKKNPCPAETEKLCPGLKPGDGKFAACVKEHEKEFSDTCKAAMAERKAKRDEMREHRPGRGERRGPPREVAGKDDGDKTAAPVDPVGKPWQHGGTASGN